jgi:hypothetical protein
MLHAVAFSSKTLVLMPILLSPNVIVSMLPTTTSPQQLIINKSTYSKSNQRARILEQRGRVKQRNLSSSDSSISSSESADVMVTSGFNWAD